MILSLVAASLLGLTVRVDSAGGAPRLLVDGQPVRARMFWGHPVPRPLPVGTAAERLEFEFTPEIDEPGKGTMHLRFGNKPCDVFLDDIRITDLDTGRDVLPICDFEGGLPSFSRQWTVWPVGEANTVGTVTVDPGVGRDGSAGLHVRLKAPRAGKWPDFHIYSQPKLALIKGHRHRVSMWVRAEPACSLQIAVYRPGNPYLLLGSPEKPFLARSYASQIKLAADAGVDFVSFPVGMPWPEPGKPIDWTASDRACEAVLSVNPRALLLPRVGMDAPVWWLKAHPDDAMLWENGPRHHAAVASSQYSHDAAERLAALIAHLEEKFGDRIAGYHPCGQNTGEWFYEDTWKPQLSGYSPIELAAWRTWLKRRYGDDAALRQAWHAAEVTLGTASLPTPAARHAAPAGVFRDPATERAIIDFNEFQQEMMADCVSQFAHAARTASQGRKLVVFFYGYLFEFGAVQGGPAIAGHYGLRRALGCPDIDVLCSPISYYDRGRGESAPSMTAAESVALAGKMWLNEDDTATHLSLGNAPGHKERVSTLPETNALLVRNVAQEAMRNFGVWWMDLGGTGWFDDPGMWAEMTRLKPLDEALLAHPTPFRPAVAAVIDERSMVRVAAGGTTVTRPGVYMVRNPLGRMGAPYGQYLLDDVAAGKVPAKMYVMLTSWCLSAQQRKSLLQATREATKIWCYAPGYFDDLRVSPEAMREVTGFDLQPVTPEKAWAEPTEMGKKLGLTQGWGAKTRVRPLFAAVDAKPDEVLARYSDGSAAVAMRRGPNGLSVFVGPPGVTSELLRVAARQSGVHLFTEVDCNVCANGPFLSVHASQDGPLPLRLQGSAEIYDVLTGQSLGRGPQVTLPIKFGETRVMRIGK